MLRTNNTSDDPFTKHHSRNNLCPFLAFSSLEAARYLETFKASVKKAPDDLIPDGGGNRSKKDLLALATDFFTSLRAVSRSDAAALLAQFKVRHNNCSHAQGC